MVDRSAVESQMSVNMNVRVVVSGARGVASGARGVASGAP